MNQKLKQTIGYVVVGLFIITVGYFGANVFFKPRTTKPPITNPPTNDNNTAEAVATLALIESASKVKVPEVTNSSETDAAVLPVSITALIPDNPGSLSAKIVTYTGGSKGYEVNFVYSGVVLDFFRTMVPKAVAKGYELKDSLRKDIAGVLVFKKDNITYKIDLTAIGENEVHGIIHTF